MVTLQNELDFLQNYILIMQARFGSRVKVHVQIPEEMKEYKIPKLLIQPLVENAIQAVSYTHLDVYKRQDMRRRDAM